MMAQCQEKTLAVVLAREWAASLPHPASQPERSAGHSVLIIAHGREAFVGRMTVGSFFVLGTSEMRLGVSPLPPLCPQGDDRGFPVFILIRKL